MQKFELREGIIFGIGNPLLDIIATVDESFLKKWDLKRNDAILADERRNGLSEDVTKNFDVKYIAGGATQNTMRVLQWLLQMPTVTSFTGCIGKDFFGKCMAAKAKSDHVNIAYVTDEDSKTGHCCVLVNGRFRSLCAYLGAANNFTEAHINARWPLIENAQIFYVSGFNLTVCPPAIMKVAKHANEDPNKRFMFNLSAEYISRVFMKPLKEVIPYVDFLFGNETEATAFAEVNGWTEKNLSDIVIKLSNMERNSDSKKRLVIISQGPDPVLISEQGSGKVDSFKVPPIPEDKLVDTNGAGDAFAAGFIAGIVQNCSIADCVKRGNYAAMRIIQQDGCSIPQDVPNLSAL